MVTVNERLNAERLDQRPGLLNELVEQDMADILTEYGARLEDQTPERVTYRPSPGLGYSVPMAGVRYYSYIPDK